MYRLSYVILYSYKILIELCIYKALIVYTFEIWFYKIFLKNVFNQFSTNSQSFINTHKPLTVIDIESRF